MKALFVLSLLVLALAQEDTLGTWDEESAECQNTCTVQAVADGQESCANADIECNTQQLVLGLLIPDLCKAEC